MTIETTQRPIRMFTTRWCGDCRRAKSFLERQAIPFEEIDIENDAEAAQRVIQANGGKRRVPTLEIDGKFYGDPPLDQLAQILGVPLG